MATAAYQTFLQWGLAAGGSQASGLLLTPSAVVDLGFQIAAPLQDRGDRHDGMDRAVEHAADHAAGHRRRRSIVVAFPLVAVALMVTQIEYQPERHGGRRAHPVWHLWPHSLSHRVLIGWMTGGASPRARDVGAGGHWVSPLQHRRWWGPTAAGNPTSDSALYCGPGQFLLCGPVLVGAQQRPVPCVAGWPGSSGSTVVSGAMGIARFPLAAPRRRCMVCPR